MRSYLSIPQRNPTLKGLSISSLGVYASVCKYFVVVAPSAPHGNTKLICDSESYQRRGWCRLEQWARIAVGGFSQMYLFVDDELELLLNRPRWLKDSIHVFEGDFTVIDDKYALVDTVCGVWAHALRSRADDAKDLRKLVQEHKASIFPKEFFGDLIEILESKIDTLVFDEMGTRHCAFEPAHPKPTHPKPWKPTESLILPWTRPVNFTYTSRHSLIFWLPRLCLTHRLPCPRAVCESDELPKELLHLQQKTHHKVKKGQGIRTMSVANLSEVSSSHLSEIIPGVRPTDEEISA